MAIALVQKSTPSHIEGANNGTVQLTGVVAGNLLVLTISYYAGDATSGASVVDSNGGAMSVGLKPTGENGGVGDTSGLGAAIYYIKNCAAGTHTVTIDMNITSAFSCYFRATLAEWSGCDTTSPLDVTTFNDGHVAGTQAGNCGTSSATSQASELVIAALAIMGNAANAAVSTPAATGFTSLDVNNPDNLSNGVGAEHSYKIVAATGTQAASWTWTDAATERWQGTLVSFKAASGAVTATVTPAPAAITMQGKTASTSAFSAVRIRNVLVNSSGQAVASRANVTLLVWYSGRPSGAADVSLNSMTTDANGTVSWSIATGSLAYLQPIFYVALGGDPSASEYTCARMIPSYE